MPSHESSHESSHMTCARMPSQQSQQLALMALMCSHAELFTHLLMVLRDVSLPCL
jgi:hypothetical protein